MTQENRYDDLIFILLFYTQYDDSGLENGHGVVKRICPMTGDTRELTCDVRESERCKGCMGICTLTQGN